MIKFYVGRKGQGKTLQMVRDSQWFFSRGYKVYSNFPVWGKYKKEQVLADFMYSEQLEETLKKSFEQKTPTLFMLDEAPVMFHSREWKSFDLDLIYALNLSRKSNIHLFMSAQSYNAIDKQLRETADYIMICEKKGIQHLLRFFIVMAVTQEYFKDDAKSVMIKRYIVKRKFNFEFTLKNFFKYYFTGQVILPQRFFPKFPTLFPDPTKISIKQIMNSSLSHKDIQPPI